MAENEISISIRITIQFLLAIAVFPLQTSSKSQQHSFLISGFVFECRCATVLRHQANIERMYQWIRSIPLIFLWICWIRIIKWNSKKRKKSSSSAAIQFSLVPLFVQVLVSIAHLYKIYMVKHTTNNCTRTHILVTPPRFHTFAFIHSSFIRRDENVSTESEKQQTHRSTCWRQRWRCCCLLAICHCFNNYCALLFTFHKLCSER